MLKNINKNSLTNKNEISSIAEQVYPYLDTLQKIAKKNKYEDDESSINLPFDKNLLKNILRIKKEKASPKLKYIIVIGIGGSNLAAKAVYDALYGSFDILNPNRFPKIIFLDTNDSEFSEQFKNFIKNNVHHPDEIFICAVSKSGETTETIANIEFVASHIQANFKNTDIYNRIVAITDYQSKLWSEAKEKKIETLEIPKKVGGRYSAFSAAHLLPLAFCGIDIEGFIEGAKDMRKLCLKKNLLENPALSSATTIFAYYKKGRIINNNFFFHPQLNSLGNWYRQLMGESLGKDKNIKGQIINKSILPIISIGSTDLHSLGQFYLAIPDNIFTIFIYSKKQNKKIMISSKILSCLSRELDKKSFFEIMAAIYGGVKEAYKNKKMPFMEIILPDISAYSLGEYMQFKMIEIMLLANLMQVDAFDQPNVELYKVETKKILENA